MARILVVNPTGRAGARRKKSMARKRRRKHRRNPRRHHRRAAHRKRRKLSGNPRRKHRRVRRKNPRRSHRRRRAHRRNPKHRVRGHYARSRSGRKHRVRGHMSNPRRRRRHRRNPGIPTWAKVALATVLGVGVYALVTDGAFAIMQRAAPGGMLSDVEKNRYILGGVAAIGGVALALTVSPIYGIAIAAAGAIGALGTKASLAVGKVLDKPLPGGATTTTTKGLGEYQPMGAYAQMSAYQPMGAVYGQDMRAVYGQDMRGMGAVYGQDMRGIGDYVPPAPYMVPTPF